MIWSLIIKESLDVYNDSSFDLIELLTNIHKLSECIQNGDADGAVGLASKLASQHVQLKAKILDKNLHEEPLRYIRTSFLLLYTQSFFLSYRIRIKIDGIDLPNNGTNKIDVLNVYRSTTIHELQAMVTEQTKFVVWY